MFIMPITLFSGAAAVAIGTPVQLGTQTGASGSSIIITTVTGCPVGSFIFVASYNDSAANNQLISSVADNASGGSNTYTLQHNVTTSWESGTAYCASTVNDLPSGGQITVTYAGSKTFNNVTAFYVAGVKASSPADIAGTNLTTGSTNTSTPGVATGTLGQANEIIFGVFNLSNTSGGVTPNAGWALIGGTDTANGVIDVYYQTVSSTGSVTWLPTWVTNRICDINVYSFKGN